MSKAKNQLHSPQKMSDTMQCGPLSFDFIFIFCLFPCDGEETKEKINNHPQKDSEN